MKTLLLVFLSIMLLSTHFVNQNNLEVTVQNVRNASGEIRIGLFANEKDFLKTPVQGKTAKANAGEVTVIFENLKPGDYAISVIHDENANGDLDTNAIGIPKEGFAFGNNAMGMFGPPSFDDSKVTVSNTPQKQVLRMKYF